MSPTLAPVGTRWPSGEVGSVQHLWTRESLLVTQPISAKLIYSPATYNTALVKV